MNKQTFTDFSGLTHQIKSWGLELGFQQVGISGTDLREAEQHLENWLQNGYQGEMSYMSRHGLKRTRPLLLEPGTQSIISVRMDYQTEAGPVMTQNLETPLAAYISRYALGRDYHKILRSRLQKLADRIHEITGPFGYRVFTDSAPVMEKAIAEKAGLGWIGKHSNLINRKAGSWFFLGEIYTDLPLPADVPATSHCGDCVACIDICPTRAIVAPYQVDARLCVSYLTIELQGSIPEALRPLIGNRIYGCDDCQLICPWNRFARLTSEQDFSPRHRLNSRQLMDLFGWDEAAFLTHTEGSAIRRIGHKRWLRNIAVALGNAPPSEEIIEKLNTQSSHESELVREHVTWAIGRQQEKLHKSA
ncbi:tRNA epoxyqueuosine(34) reductase QueG [Methylicorpusculum sp.]|uniref:tRNA epoxyqueuosine(34) reductase QueG n=1 Tax=Methylicorpusculum sp. TaxID=2713644 RepID=UPI002731D887|nr:tRNA epoxyqueuosine(34) reductase QueG [Methylicorpusculum sp.]MDP2178946.1 tRNA epoxyqueuosine(34) reductase QueG [Methylicorpusculum sp.]MDP3530959.1 tRNA epoxyqueuosine(34) reductase QueG [Methylicorpusculum sp.]MDZ4150102.1 tRNA epoxyqueuosine(34) reductase QueG [Methylicorpusculum sp.]